MHKDIRDLIAWAKTFGWSVERKAAHIVLRHENGASTTLPHTPSDHRSVANARRDLLRLAGKASPSGPAGKYRKGMGRRRDRYNPQRALDQRDDREVQRIERLLTQMELNVRERELAVEIRKYNPRRDSVILLKLAAELSDVRSRLREYRRQAKKDQGL
jgi:hypothetical protein